MEEKEEKEKKEKEGNEGYFYSGQDLRPWARPSTPGKTSNRALKINGATTSSNTSSFYMATYPPILDAP
jgi:hypothetical protein